LDFIPIKKKTVHNNNQLNKKNLCPHAQKSKKEQKGLFFSSSLNFSCFF